MARVIVLKYAATCADCGASLAVGTEARFYGRGKVYGLTCHEKRGRDARRSPFRAGPVDGSRGARRSFYDPIGVYASDGTYLGKVGGRCEDAPCCGCCS